MLSTEFIQKSACSYFIRISCVLHIAFLHQFENLFSDRSRFRPGGGRGGPVGRGGPPGGFGSRPNGHSYGGGSRS